MDHRFELDNFAGPLDLLLYLVQREEVDIREVSLVNICDQYIDEIEKLKGNNIEPAGDFFVMAATLMAIKARSLLPEEEIDLAEELDPEEELIQQLLEYRRIKEASRHLGHQAQARSLVHPSRPEVSDAGIPLDEVDVFDLVTAFRKILQETGLDRDRKNIIRSERPMGAYVQDLLGRLRAEPTMSFFKVFAGSTTRDDLIGFFLAILELIRHGVVRARQEQSFGEIRIEAQGEVPANLTSVYQPLTSDALDADEDAGIHEDETTANVDANHDANDAPDDPVHEPEDEPDRTSEVQTDSSNDQDNEPAGDESPGPESPDDQASVKDAGH